jgi:hypothetical protein
MMKVTVKDWEPLLAACASQSETIKKVAAETYYMMERLGNGSPMPLWEAATIVRAKLQLEGYDYDIDTLQEYRRTAAWVMDNTDGKMGWVDYRTYTHHKRARRRHDWTYPRLMAEEPLTKAQGLDPGSAWGRIIRRARTELMRSHELVGVDRKYTQGKRKEVLAGIEDGTGAAVEALNGVLDDMDKL